MNYIIQLIAKLLMKIIKTIGMQYISEDVAPVVAPPDADRPALFLNTVTGFQYNWNITTQAWVPIPKVYRARLIQTGVDDPVATEFENSLGGTVTWTRQSLGVYRGALSVTFASTKGFVLLGPLLAGDPVTVGQVFSGSAILLTTVNVNESPLLADGLLNHTAVELSVYP